MQKSDFATVLVLEIEGKVNVVNKPEIKSDASIFIDKAKFKITTTTPNAVVRYTTDGTEPTLNSSKAEGTITFEMSDFVVKARVFVNNKAVSQTSERRFVKSNPMPAMNSLKPGLLFELYSLF